MLVGPAGAGRALEATRSEPGRPRLRPLLPGYPETDGKRRRRLENAAEEIEQLFADLWQVFPFSRGMRRGFRPQADVYRTEDPARSPCRRAARGRPERGQGGRSPQALLVAGERRRPKECGQYQQLEIEYGPFQRQVTLAEDVDPEQATATYERGYPHDQAPDSRRRPAPAERIAIMVSVADERRLSGHADRGAQEEIVFPATLPVLPLKDTVVFPEAVTPLAIGQERSIKLVEDVVSGDRLLALVTVEDYEAEQPGWDDLYEVGTAAVVHKMIKVPDGTLRILVQGLQRIKLERPGAGRSVSRRRVRRVAGRSAETPRSKRSRATSRTSSRASSASFPICPRSCRSRRRTSTTRARSAISSPRRCG